MFAIDQEFLFVLCLFTWLSKQTAVLVALQLPTVIVYTNL